MIDIGDILSVAAIFLAGTVIGSWLNVVILRNVNKREMVWERSNCMFCHKRLRWWELIPIFSFIFLKARCARCRAAISAQYPIVEFFMGIFAVIVFMPLPTLAAQWLLSLIIFAILGVLIVLFFIDFYTFLLPDFYIVLLSVLSLLLLASKGVYGNLLLNIIVGSGFLLILWIITKGQGIGFGDVKLMIPLSMITSFQGVLVLLWLAFFAGGVVGLYLLATNRASLKTAVPFGPYLIGAGIIVFLAAEMPDYLFSFLLG